MFIKFTYNAYVEGRKNEDGREEEYVYDVAIGLAEIVTKQASKIDDTVAIGPVTMIHTELGKKLKLEGKPIKYIPYYDGSIGY